jgi:hypothetical protein
MDRIQMPESRQLSAVVLSRSDFVEDRQGRTFSDVLNDSAQPLDEVLAFFSDGDRQGRMEEAEIHHDRAPLAGVIRELEADPAIDAYFAAVHPLETKRLRQAIGIIVRIVMEGRGWKKTGRKGSMGVRAATATGQPLHNTGGLSFWFVRAERYELAEGMPYRSVAERRQEFTAPARRKVADVHEEKSKRPRKKS